jgi:large subunit ribosomal protein L20
MRVKGGSITRQRRRKVIKAASGYFGSKHTIFKTAKEQVLRSYRYSWVDRKDLKNTYRKLWIKRINAACRLNDVSYSTFMHGLKLANVNVNRKMLSELAINDPKGFTALVEQAKAAK